MEKDYQNGEFRGREETKMIERIHLVQTWEKGGNNMYAKKNSRKENESRAIFAFFAVVFLFIFLVNISKLFYTLTFLKECCHIPFLHQKCQSNYVCC